MNKYLKLLILTCLLTIFPINALAMIEYDDKGNVIEYDLEDKEVRITSINDDEDYNIIDDEAIITNDDTQFTDNEEVEAIALNEDENQLIFIISSSILGLIIGCGLTYFILSKKA